MITVNVKELDRFFAQYEGYSSPLYRKVRDWWLQLNTISGSVNIDSQTAFVSDTEGNDLTGEVGNLNKPFATITGALTQSTFVCIISNTYLGTDNITTSCFLTSMGNTTFITINSIDDTTGGLSFLVQSNCTVFGVFTNINITNSSTINIFTNNATVALSGINDFGGGVNVNNFACNCYSLQINNGTFLKSEVEINVLKDITLDSDILADEGFIKINADTINLGFVGNTTVDIEFKNLSLLNLKGKINLPTEFQTILTDCNNVNITGDIDALNTHTLGIFAFNIITTTTECNFNFNGNLKSSYDGLLFSLGNINPSVSTITGSIECNGNIGIHYNSASTTDTLNIKNCTIKNTNGAGVCCIYLNYYATQPIVTFQNVKMNTTGAVNVIETDAVFPNTRDIYVMSIFANNGNNAQVNNLVVGATYVISPVLPF